jgi:hypothetical protein
MQLRFLTVPAFLATILVVVPCQGVSFTRAAGNHELYVELEDPYYFCTGLYYSLRADGIPALGLIDEWPLYRRLLNSWYQPNCLVLEAGVAPMPLMGVAVKQGAPAQYQKAVLGNVNLINAMTESVDFKEPGSFSVFVGHMLAFKSSGAVPEGNAVIGFLASYGCYHIHNNDLLADHWGELEAKLKVVKKGTERRYATSYRIGTRLHSHADVKDLFYVSLKRDRTDFSGGAFSLIRNTNAQIRCDCSYQPLQVLSVFVEAGKKFPFRVKNHSGAVGLSLGVGVYLNSAYSGIYAQEFTAVRFSPVIRPLLTL